MKNYFLKLFLAIIALTSLQFCTDKEDSAFNQALDGTTKGAILRIVSEPSKTFNFFDTSSKWSIVVEAQDEQDGQLLKEVRMFSKYTKGTVTTAERLYKTFPASVFKVAGNRNLPQYTISITLAETLSFFAITAGSYTPADEFAMRFEYVMTDGRIFTTTNTSTPVTNGYFNAPYRYAVQFFCPLANAADFNGNYKVTADAWEDYSVGDTVPVTFNIVDGLYTFKIRNTNNAYLNNRNSSYIITINPANGNVTGRSSEGLAYIGRSALTNVAITGSVGTCTGDINLLLTFSGDYTGANQAFKLKKI